MSQLGKGKMTRRSLFRGTLIAGAVTVAPAYLNRGYASDTARLGSVSVSENYGLSPYTQTEHQPFMHGVASGDPLPNSVILWTRVTPTVESVPGSGQGPDVRVGWEISATPDFARIARSGTAIATAANDHTVHVDPFELAPDTVYFYRFRLLDGDQSGRVSRIGRTRTTPLDDAHSAQLRLAVCSCANFEAGYFGAYSDIARRAYADEIDVVVHMGDYIYEYASGDYAGKYGVVRPHVPTWELRVLSDYRSRYGHYRRDVELQEAHAAAPWVVTWDDHEIANDAWSGGASDHTEKQGDWYSRRDAAMQAYLEWLPVRGGAPSRGGRIYRTLRFGRLAELNMLDLRSYRSAPGVFRPIGQETQDHTIMGQEQFEWLSARLSNTSARWNLIGTSAMMSPLNLLDIGSVVHQPLLEMVGFEDTETPVNSDQWDGYVADRERLLAQLGREHAHGRTVFLTGDIHSEWANHIVHEDRVIAAELVCSSVSAPNVDDVLTLPANNPASTSAEAHILRHNSHISHVDLDAHGYATLTITEDGAEMSWQRCTDVTVAGSGVQAGPTRRYDGARISV